MRVPTHHDDRRQTDVAMTPMIDVVFQLMIFFICTASFQAAEELLPMGLAESGTSASAPIELEPEMERIVVRGTRTDNQTDWLVNERPCESLREVRQVLQDAAEIDRSPPVILDVAGVVPLGDMIDMYDLCRLLGFEKIQFAAERK